jgi:hypothetical protein
MTRLHLVRMLLVAGVVSLAAGLAASWVAGLVPCRGERLACNIDAAVGGYGAIIWAALGPLIFGVTLLVAKNRVALAGAMAVLLLPLVGFFCLAKFDSWRYVGFYPDKDLRTFLVMFVLPALTVLVQYLILRLVVPPTPERPQ